MDAARCCRLLLAATTLATAAAFAQPLTTLPGSPLPRKDDRPFLPDSWLLGQGQPWHHRIAAATTPARPLGRREPRPDEQPVVDDAAALLEAAELKALLLLHDGDVVGRVVHPALQRETLLLSASIAKTVTAVAVGLAVCDGLLGPDTRAGELLPELRGRDLAEVTLHDLLRMASGMTEPPPRDATGVTAAEVLHHLQGPGSLRQLVSGERLSRRAAPGVGAGERFAYKSVDPFTVALMLQAATGEPATRWIERRLLRAVPIAGPAVLGTDRHGDFAGAEGSVRLTLDDWARLALHVQEQRAAGGCFGDWLRRLSSTQIRTPLIDGINGWFAGYGYFTWTANRAVPDSFWAAGYGGQRIGWSTDPANRRIVITFGNAGDRHMQRVYALARRWLALR